jgi:Holliday junction resolvase-like predicted endonuclease
MHAYVGHLIPNGTIVFKLLFVFPQKISKRTQKKLTKTNSQFYIKQKKNLKFLVFKFDTICLKETLGVRQPSILPL